MALASFLQHLEVLGNCGLVRSRKTGRIRTYRIEPQAFAGAEGWIAKQRTLWNAG